MKCEKCDTEMKFFIKESTQGWKCPNCNWGIVTTYIEPIKDDKTIYAIILTKNSNYDKSQLKEISRIASCNFIKAKELLESENIELVKDNAVAIKEFATTLKENKINFEITPDYIYKY